jgi:heat shock protein HtpX
MNFLFEARNIGHQKRRNKILTLLVMGGFACSLGLLGYGFDYAMGAFERLQVITVPIAIMIFGSLLFNLVDGLNERLYADEDPEDRSEYYTNRVLIWMVSTTFFIIVWMFFSALSTIDPHGFGRAKQLLVIGTTSPYGTLVGTLLGAGAAFSTLQWGAYSILRSVEASPADPTFEADHLITSVVEELSKVAGIPPPAIFVVQDEAPNLFSIGRSPKHAYLVVSQGLLDTLGREELEAAVAHEIGHIRSYDIRLKTAVTALFGSVILLSHGVKRVAGKGSVARVGLPTFAGARRVLLLMFWLASLLVVPVAAYALVILTFRRREYLADVSAAELTHAPHSLVTALQKIEQSTEPPTIIKGNVSHLCIIDPLNRKANSREGWFADLLATHPPTEKRILNLQSMVPFYASR